MIVVGTHYDELPSAGRQELITKYRKLIFTRFVSDKHGGGLLNISQHGIPRVVDVVEISSKPKSEHNIRELRGLIYDNVLSVQDFGMFCILIPKGRFSNYLWGGVESILRYLMELSSPLSDLCKHLVPTPGF